MTSNDRENNIKELEEIKSSIDELEEVYYSCIEPSLIYDAISKIVNTLRKFRKSNSFNIKLNHILADCDGWCCRQLLVITEDLLFTNKNSLSDNEKLQIFKLIECRFNNLNFELQLAEMITGDNSKFPYRDGDHITEFFWNLGWSYKYDDCYNKKIWVQAILKRTKTEELYYEIIKELFNEKYFKEHCKAKNIEDINNFLNEAKEEFKKFASNNIDENVYINIDDCFDLNIITELLINKKINTNDKDLNSIIEKAKEYFREGDKQTAVEKIWDAFERIKTFDTKTKDKKESSEKLINIIGTDIVVDNNVDDTKEVEFTGKTIFDNEFNQLTKIGNKCRIRHSETDKITIDDSKILNYLFFRMYSLIDLCATKIEEKEQLK